MIKIDVLIVFDKFSPKFPKPETETETRDLNKESAPPKKFRLIISIILQENRLIGLTMLKNRLFIT